MIGRLQAPEDNEDEEEMLRRAIAMSLEEGEVTEQERYQGAGKLYLQNIWWQDNVFQCSGGVEKKTTFEDYDDEAEEEMLRRAIAMSLEEEE